jgi:hypothetical protein
MPMFRESALRRIADQATIRMFDTWKVESKTTFGQSLEIIADDRRNNPMLKTRGLKEVNTALPEVYNGEPVLKLWLDKLSNPDLIIITHEIGHLVLKLRGHKGLLQKPRDLYKEMLLNDLGLHVPLYALQRSIGHDPQKIIDERASHTIEMISNANPDSSINATEATVRWGDDFMNCGQEKRLELRQVLTRRLPKTMNLINQMVGEASRHNLHEPTDNIAFRRAIVKMLDLGEWDVSDDIGKIRKVIESAQAANPNPEERIL